jgi:hypothetical protein
MCGQFPEKKRRVGHPKVRVVRIYRHLYDAVKLVAEVIRLTNRAI